MTLETHLNTKLKQTYEWSKANRLSLNIGKIKLLICRAKHSKVNFDNISIKLQGSPIITLDFR